MMLKRVVGAGAVAAVGLMAAAGAALAYSGQPSPWQKNLQEPVTTVARDIYDFHTLLLWIISVISLFVLALLIIVVLRFNERANPTPTRTSHNTLLEVAWTVIPIFILLVIAVPSFRLLFKQYDFPKADVTIKAIGHQWYWTHEYPDHGISFDSVMVRDEDLLKQRLGEADFNKLYAALSDIDKQKRMYADSKPLWEASNPKRVRLLSVDNDVVLPVGKNIHVLVTADDVIHNWTIPSFGSKVDAVPGRTLATWFRAEKKGIYYGQCSELCGKDHAAMPIAVRIVDDAVYQQWLAAMKAKDRKRARDIIDRAAIEDQGAGKLADAAGRAGK